MLKEHKTGHRSKHKKQKIYTKSERGKTHQQQLYNPKKEYTKVKWPHIDLINRKIIQNCHVILYIKGDANQSISRIFAV